MASMQMSAGVMAVVPSGSNPFKCYEVRCGHDGVVYCTCPAWRFQKQSAGSRKPCKHIRAVANRMAKRAA